MSCFKSICVCFVLLVASAPASSQYQVSTIVIDAGHGGHDPGTKGNTYYEKEIALDIAQRLGAKISAAYPNVAVHYTRNSDKFIPLYERIGLANKVNADLFISIHCNSSPNKNVKGTETYIMGLHRADENLGVAKRENDVVLLENDYEANYDGFDPKSPIGHILLSSFQNAYLGQSLEIASKVEKSLKSRGHTASRGVKQAGFAVLRRATMPAMLVETGFLSNSSEEQYLGSNGGREDVSNALFQALSPLMSHTSKKATNSEKPVVAPTKPVANAPKADKNDKTDTIEKTASPGQFKVQFAAMKNEIELKEGHPIHNVGPLLLIQENGYYKYQIGPLTQMTDAKRVQADLAKIGYKSAFIIGN